MQVIYRSRSDPDYQCLEEYLEAGAFGALPDAWIHQAQHDLNALEEVFQTVISKMPWLPDGIQKELTTYQSLQIPTKFDSPLNFSLLENLVTRIKSAATDVGLNVENFPHYSCIPTRQVNACAVNLTCSKKAFLLFDSQLFLFCHLFAKAFASCLPVTKSGEMVSLTTKIEKVRARISETPEILERLIDVLRAYVTTDSPSNAKQYFLEEDYEPILSVIRDGMELFVVGHEFGHVYAGHLNDLLARNQLHAFEDIGNNESHQQEHEADFLGMLLTLNAMHKREYDAGLSFIGINLFFISLDMADQYAHLLGGEKGEYESTSSDTHPSSQVRRDVLRGLLEHMVSPIEQVESARMLSLQYDAIASHLWTEIKRLTDQSNEPA